MKPWFTQEKHMNTKKKRMKLVRIWEFEKHMITQKKRMITQQKRMITQNNAIQRGGSF